MWGDNLKTIPEGVDGKAALEEVRARVFGRDGPAPGSAESSVAYLRSEHMLVRFLIARKWDVEKATEMLRDHYKWLAEKNMSKLLQDPFPEEQHIKKFYPQTFHGTDKMGRPIYIERPGHIDMPRLLQVTTPERVLEYCYASTEWRGRVVDKSLNIMDLEDLGFRVVTHSTARKVLKTYVEVLQNHYPEQAGKMVIINAPKVFGIAWSFVKPLLDEKTVGKISIYGTDRAAYTQALLELVDEDQLPALFGGKCVCDGQDHLSCMCSMKGPWVDPEVKELLESHPVDQIMTPEGAKLLVNRRAGSAGQASGLGGGGATTGSDGEKEAEDEEEEARDGVELPPIEEKPVSPEVQAAERDVTSAMEEYQMHERVHMQTLSEWVEEFNRLHVELGRYVIERAQSYYDSLSLWQTVTQEYARQSEEVEQVNQELDAAVKTLSKVEQAFEAFISGGQIVEEDWASLVPLKPELVRAMQGMESDEKLLWALRVSTASDKVALLQRQRDAAVGVQDAKTREFEEVKRRFEQEEASHSGCTWNCSVKRAAPFYEKRRAHELKVETQLAEMRRVEQQLYGARQRLADLQNAGLGLVGRARSVRSMLSSRSRLDEMSLHSFEIAGAEPCEDEFMSCCGSINSDN